MSSSSSSSSSSGNSGNGNGGVYGGEYEGPSRSRPRANNEAWPEHFVEALAAQVAIDASRIFGRLAAAQAIVNVFQVCRTWRAVSSSDLLWHRLSRRIWGRTHLLHDTWHQEYIYRHRTAGNFRNRITTHFTLHYDPADVDDPDDPDAHTCRCLALSDHYLACGFADGAVRLFDLHTRLHSRTFRPEPRDRLGRFSRAVSGIIINDARLIFATLDGLHAGVPGRAFHIWDGNTEQLTFVGGALTDPNSVLAWHTLAELTELVGRVRVTNHESAVACTSQRLMVFDLRNQGVILHQEEPNRGIIVSCFDVWNDAFVVVNNRGMGIVRRVSTLQEVCRFNVRLQRGLIGCINGGYALICAGGVIRVWEIEQRGGELLREYLYSLRERIGEVNALVADDRHVAASSGDGSIHLWDFGAQWGRHFEICSTI
ncbi:hypothetical protein GH714_030590 [Hevea brasiliensis]|uniref:F-box domain-containing protein n=1 Tax=Hevea brasiliensis TaxID=3981 RepID=A0A6A6K9W7_HEVBR|nr:hypothetical protein GH714_030590 [Hevea brasiliensis]